MSSAETPKPNRRQAAKAATRQKVVDAARACFTEGSYAHATIRQIAARAGMSTGAVFANFDGKEDLWRAAMKCEPPLDSPATRAAPVMLAALKLALQFIENGIELGYVRLPEAGDPAVATPGILRDTIALAERVAA